MDLRKTRIEIICCVAVICATCVCLLKEDGLGDFVDNLKYANEGYIVLSLVLLLAYILLESVIIKIIMSALDEDVSLLNCFKYSFVGFFFYCITPAGSGEQPAQMYAMHKDGVSVHKSVFALTIITITFKLAIVMLGLFVHLFKPPQIEQMIEPIAPLCILGFWLSLATVILLICLLCIPASVERIAKAAIKVLVKTGLLKNPEAWNEKIEAFVLKYCNTVSACRAKPKMLIAVMLVTLVQRICILAITAASALTIGENSMGTGTIIAVQGMIQLATEMMPLPGGVALNEWLFLSAFKSFFGKNTLSVLVISRGISFYGQLIICGAVTALIAAVTNIRGRNRL